MADIRKALPNRSAFLSIPKKAEVKRSRWGCDPQESDNHDEEPPGPEHHADGDR